MSGVNFKSVKKKANVSTNDKIYLQYMCEQLGVSPTYLVKLMVKEFDNSIFELPDQPFDKTVNISWNYKEVNELNNIIKLNDITYSQAIRAVLNELRHMSKSDLEHFITNSKTKGETK